MITTGDVLDMGKTKLPVATVKWIFSIHRTIPGIIREDKGNEKVLIPSKSSFVRFLLVAIVLVGLEKMLVSINLSPEIL